jgi:hypothetical protein
VLISLKIGGFYKDDVPDKKHKGEEFILVVNGSFKRTLKVIDIIGHGAPIVSENWLRACEKADTFVGKENNRQIKIYNLLHFSNNIRCLGLYSTRQGC